MAHDLLWKMLAREQEKAVTDLRNLNITLD
jgi:hypothetical protein